jgi:hypothetical protein
MIYVALIVSLIVLAFENFMHYRERKDLYSRIMAKDLSDYATIIEKKKPPGKAKSFIRDKMEELRRNDVID